MLRQCVLVNTSTQSTMLVWLELPKTAKIGARVTLKGVDDLWEVRDVYATEQSSENLRFTRGWNNNI